METPQRFWQGMTKAADVDLLDKIMLGKNTDGSTKYGDINMLLKLLSIVGSASFKGNVIPTDSPVVSATPAFYVGSPGTYPNFGGVVITGAAGIIGQSEGVFKVSNINVDLSPYAEKVNFISRDKYSDLLKTLFVIENGVLNGTVTIQANGGSSVYNAIDNALEVSAPSANTGVLLGNIPVIGINYNVDFEARLKSGTAGSIWNIGWPLAGEGIDFVADGTWKKFSGQFARVTSTIYPLLVGMGATPGNGVIQIKNMSLRKADEVTINIDKRVSSFEGFNIGGIAFDLQAEINKRDNVFIPVGQHIISDLIDVPSGKNIYGVRGKSIIKAGAALTQVFQINGKSDVTLKDFTLKGVAADVVLGGGIPMPVGGKIDSLSHAITKNAIGSKIGIGLTASERINISGMRICNFDAYGILNSLSGKPFEYGVKMTDNYFNDNYLGMEMNSEAEYSSYVGNTFSRNQIGLLMDGGNNLFANNHFDKNRVGVILGHGLNNSHGSFTGCTFNHNALFGLISNEITVGEAFSGCQFWYGDIYLLNSKGVNITGGIIGASTVFIDGANGGQNQILGVCFSSASVQQNYNGNLSKVTLKNNFFMDGSDSSAINN